MTVILVLGLFTGMITNIQILTITDETSNGSILNMLRLKVRNAPISVRELIKMRVYQEVKTYNSHRTGCFRGLVGPKKSEEVLNGYVIKPWKKIDPDRLYKNTILAFRHKRFKIFVNGNVIDDLDECVFPSPILTISFLKAY